MPLVGSAALAELWARAKAAFVSKVGVNAASTTVDVQLKNSSGTILQTGTLPAATASTAGVLTAADKAKLDGIATGATKVSVDTALSASSTNPVQNKVVNSALANKADTTATGSKLTATAGTTTVSVTYPGETTYTQVEADSVTIGLANSSGTELSSVNVVTGDKYVAGANIAITDHVISATYGAATASAPGLMSAADKAKLDGVAGGANKTTVDSAISATSTNPVQNKAVSAALAAKAPLASPELTGTPTAPTAAAGTNTAQIATTAFVTAAVTSAMASATQFQGTLTDAKQLTGASYRRGQYWVVKTAGTYASQSCEVGDMVFCISSKGTDYSSSDFSVVQNNVVEMTAAEVDSICV